MVALPGLGLTGQYLLPLALELAPHLRTYVVDLPGSGGAPGPAGRLQAGQLAVVVERWLQANELGEVVLFGNSYGSEVALETALRAGSRIAGVVLGAPTPDPSARSLARQLGRLARAAAYASPRLLAIALRDYRRTGLRLLLRESAAALDEPIVERLKELRTPALVVRGGRDPVVPQRWAEEAARLANAELAVVPDAGHAAPYARPHDVARLIVAFAAGLSGARAD